jgi:hypothetical protein
MCGNCQKRNNPCSYAPYPKRRGPGKAPKGHRKPSKSASQGTTGPPGTPSADHPPPRHRASVETLPVYTPNASSSETHLPLPPTYGTAGTGMLLPPPPPSMNEPTPLYPQHYRYPSIPIGPSSSHATGAPSTSRPFGGPQPQYPHPALEETNLGHASTVYGRPSFDVAAPQMPYPTPMPLDVQRMGGPSRGRQQQEGWPVEGARTNVPGRDDRHEEHSSRELYEFYHDEQQQQQREHQPQQQQQQEQQYQPQQQ